MASWSLGPGVDNQQVGGTWTEGDEIVSLSMSSDLNIFDKRVSEKPSRTIQVGSNPCASFLLRNIACPGPSKSGDRCPPNRIGNFLDGYCQREGVVVLCYRRGVPRRRRRSPESCDVSLLRRGWEGFLRWIRRSFERDRWSDFHVSGYIRVAVARSHPLLGQPRFQRSPNQNPSQSEGTGQYFWQRSMGWRWFGITRRHLNSRPPSLRAQSTSMVLWWQLGERSVADTVRAWLAINSGDI